MTELLAILRGLPYPSTSGGERRSRGLLEGLAREFDLKVFVCTPAGEERRRLALEHLPGSQIAYFSHRGSGSIPRRATRQLMHPAMPAGLTRFDLAGLRRCLGGELQSSRPRVVWVDDPLGWWLARSLGFGPRTAVDLKDVPHVFHRQNRVASRLTSSRSVTGLLSQTRAQAEHWKWTVFERTMIRSAALVTLCSDADRERLGEKPNVVVVPNGYERSRIGGFSDQLPGVPRPRLVIQGSYDYSPNVVAATDFARDILPLIRRKIPSATLVAAGKHSDEVAELTGSSDVVTTGFVQNMSAMVQSCDIVAVPVRSGSGTRVKILEAWANGVAVVSTTLGAEGLGATHGHEILLADDPEHFAESCVAVLSDRSLRAGLVRSAHQLFEKRYVWDEIVSNFVAVFRDHLARDDGSR